jgi:hypothetical protein
MFTCASCLLGLALLLPLRAQDPGPVTSRPADAPPPAGLQAMVFDIRDLVALRGGHVDRNDVGTLPATEALLALLRAFLPRQQGLGPNALRPVRGMLIAQLDHEQTDWLRATLDRQRDGVATVVRIEARAIAGLPAGHQALAGCETPRALADAAAVTELMASVVKVPGIRLLPAIQLALVPCAPGQAESLVHVSYIKEWVLQRGVQPGNRTILDPVIDVARGGTILRGQALLLGEQLVGLEVGFTLLDLQQPIPSRKISVEGQELEVGVPSASTTRIDATLTLPVGRTVVIGTPKGQQPGALLLLAVTAVEPPDKRR